MPWERTETIPKKYGRKRAFAMNITVYLGANQGNDPALGRAVEELGRWIGESGHRLIYGGSKSGLMGVLSDGQNIPLYTIGANASGKTKWADKSADEILADVNGMAKQVAKITKNVERPDTLCVPADVFMDISTRRIPDTSTTVLAFIQEHAPYIKNVVSTAELDADSPETNPYATSGNPQGVAFLFKNDPRKLTLENPMPFYQYPLQVEKLETIILCEARTAGVIVYYPLSALIAVGVS